MRIPKVLSVQDISCVGQCSLTVALPVLSACGVEACPLPTALLSTHTGGYGAPHVRDLTDDMPAVAAHWKEAGITFDVISCGYLGGTAQLIRTARILDGLLAPGGKLIFDPAMADHGKLYSGIDGGFVEAAKGFCAGAYCILPNVTEACLLTGTEYREDYDEAWIGGLMDKLEQLGSANVVLTGVSYDPDTTGVMLGGRAGRHYVSHQRLPESFFGTGDAFAAAFAGAAARRVPLKDAASFAAKFTLTCVADTVAEGSRNLVFQKRLGRLAELIDRILLREI